MNKKYIQAIFCQPSGEFEELNVTNRLTDEVFKELKSCGINRIFGYGFDTRDETIKKLFELCEKYDMIFLPTPKIRSEYSDVSGKYTKFNSLTKEEICDLDRRFIEEINVYKKYKSFGGIFFEDETGYLSFDGVAHAKRVFDEFFPEYEFHYNFYSYSINKDIFLGGQTSEYSLDGESLDVDDIEFTFQNRFDYYDKLVEGLLSKANFKFISMDKYPYEYWTEPVYHQGMFDLPAYFYLKKKKYGAKFYNYMQVGQWFRESDLSFAQISFYQHVSSAYGCDGFAYFPGCFPVDWANFKGTYEKAKRGGSSLIDLDGKPTKYLEYFRNLYHGFFEKIENDILSSELIKVNTFGKFDNGVDINHILKDLEWSESVYIGKISDFMKGEIENIKIDASNQVLVSEFMNTELNKKRYYIVNTQTEKEVEITLNTGFENETIYRLDNITKSGPEVTIKLAPGEGIYITEN